MKTLYVADHHGSGTPSEADLQPYSKEFERVLASCKIRSGDLTGATTFIVAGEVRALGGEPVSSLMMLQAFTRRITWSAPRDCWNTFFDVEKNMEVRVASALEYVNRHEIQALYVFDHSGANPRNDVALLPYSKALARIVGSCTINLEDTTNNMIELSQKASELGARRVTALMMMEAVTRRIDWTGRKDCTTTIDNAEGHMESGGP